MSDTKEIARAVAKEVVHEFAQQTNAKIEQYQIQTQQTLQQLGKSMTRMADSMEESNISLARYEEKQSNSSERMERIESTQKEQADLIHSNEKEHNETILELRDEVKDNSVVRRAILWLSAALVLAMLGGGMLFSSITGRTPP